MSLDLKDIRRIVEMMDKHDLALLDLEKDNFKLKLKKHTSNNEEYASNCMQYMSNIMGSNQPNNQINDSRISLDIQNPPNINSNKNQEISSNQIISSEEIKEEKSNLIDIVSPMVGTFYKSPNPESSPFFSIGDKINSGDTICIIEAMKVMNEIKAESSGILEEILVEDGSPVQYGEVLFKLKP